jgi:hypothetical protein
MDDLPHAEFSISSLYQMPLNDSGEHENLGGSKSAHTRYVLDLGQDLSQQSAMPSPLSDKEPSHEFTFMDDLSDADFSISGLNQMPLNDYSEHENLWGKQRCSLDGWI